MINLHSLHYTPINPRKDGLPRKSGGGMECLGGACGADSPLYLKYRVSPQSTGSPVGRAVLIFYS